MTEALNSYKLPLSVGIHYMADCLKAKRKVSFFWISPFSSEKAWILF